MKKFAFLIGIMTIGLFSCNNSAEEEAANELDSVIVEKAEEEEPTAKVLLSPRMEATGVIAANEIYIDYGAPSVRGREIWGKLVKYDKLWRAGANETTAITFSADTQLNGKDIPAGTYGFFIIPKENQDWTLVFNEEWSVDEHEAWGSSHYQEEKDVLRIDVTPEWNEESEDLLTYSIEEAGISFAWEKAKFMITVE